MLDLIAPSQLAAFMAAALALNLTPGPDMMLCLGQGLRGGPAAGMAASLGVATGALIHAALAAAGLAALLATEPLLFEVIRWTGVAYLAWLAVKMVRSLGAGTLVAADPAQSTPFAAWRDGTVVNLLNPKVALFILAFIPQFVDPARGSELAQFLVLALLFNISGTIVNALVGVFAGRLGAVMATSRRLRIALEAATASVFLLIALRLAFDRR